MPDGVDSRMNKVEKLSVKQDELETLVMKINASGNAFAVQLATQQSPSRASKGHAQGSSFLVFLLQRDLRLRGNVFALLNC